MNKILQKINMVMSPEIHKMSMNIRSIIYKRKILAIAAKTGLDIDGDLLHFKNRKYVVHVMDNYVKEVE